MNAPNEIPQQEVAMLNIYQRLNEIRKDVAYIRKEKEVTGAGTYKVVTHDQVTREIRESLIKHGVIIVPRLTKSVCANSGTLTGKGIPIIRYEAFYEIDFVNCDAMDKVTVSIEAHALDQGDKAPGKAISYATKYAILKLFSIETGEDEESRLDMKAAKGGDEGKRNGNYKPAFNVLGFNPKVSPDFPLEPQDKVRVEEVVEKTLKWLANNKLSDAVLELDNADLHPDQWRYAWTFFDSTQRSSMKKEAARLKEEINKKESVTT